LAKYKEYHQNQIMLMPPSLDEKVPEAHLARYISKVVDELDMEDIEKGYSELGCSAYNPRMLLKLLIYGYSINIRSSRRIQRESREDVIFMWLAGLQEPDFRTISDFRKERIKDIKALFTQVLNTCRELGIVRCGKISIDGTKIEANSSRNKLTYRKSLDKRKIKYEEEVERILEEAERIDAEEDRLYGDKDGYSMDKAYTADDIKKALKKIQKEKEKLNRKVEKTKDKLEVIEKKIETMGNERNSFGNTDKDATLMLMKEGNLDVGYNVQIATENQVIVAFDISHRPNDVHLLRPMIEEVERNLRQTPEAFIADKGYSSQSNLEYLEKRNIKAAIPHQNYDYDRVKRKKGTYRLSKNLAYEKLKLKMMDFLETDEGKGLMDKRKYEVEPTFGDIKHNMGFRKFLLRTNLKVATEIGLISIAHNIKKMKGWTKTRESAPGFNQQLAIN
jgi:transposase